MKFNIGFGVAAFDWSYRLFYNFYYSKHNESTSLFKKYSANQTFCKLSNL